MFIVSVLLLGISVRYVEFLKSSKDSLIASKNKLQAKSMQESVSSMILLKQKSTVAMALSIANNKELCHYILDGHIPEGYYEKLIQKIKYNTLYKNIWIQILDNNATSLYRSWSKQHGDNLLNIRNDLSEVIASKKVTFSVSVGKFDLSIKAIVPVFLEEKFVGILEVISHFNSISKQLHTSGIDSVVILKKEYKNQLDYPFTKMFIGDYYVANFDAPKYMMQYLQKHGLENYFNDEYRVENGYLIVSDSLKDLTGQTIGYFIMSKKIKEISNMDLEFFMFKWISLGVIALLCLMIVFGIVMFYANRMQKKYYKNIIDTATNVVVINDKKKILAVNHAFFDYFTQYKTLEEFKSENECICDFFVEGEGYLDKMIDGIQWVDYLVADKSQVHKAKLKIGENIYYFRIGASIVSDEKLHYSIVLSDITQEELYKIKLERLVSTDFLTGIYNRRYFMQKIEEETNQAKRYEYPLSVVMFDIDHFKQVNDIHGHAVGDEVLVEYTKLIKGLLRQGDTFCRVGGEEFVIILPHIPEEEAVKTAEKLRKEVNSSRKILPITMSFGVTQYIKGENIEFLFKRVDSALYRAKETGRNNVVVE